MTGRTFELLGLLWLTAIASSFAAAVAPQHVLVTVVDRHVTPARPVTGIRVAVIFFDGSQPITDDRERTNGQGQIDLAISAEAVQRGDLRIVISDAHDLVIYQPSEGLLNAVPARLTLELLPKGSPALLEPAQIEAMLNRLSRLTIQNRQLAAAVQKKENQGSGFDEALKEWAAENGLSYDQVNERVQGWASDILAHQQEESLQKRAEAELGLRHYDRAAILFRELADDNDSDLDRERNAFLAQQLEKLRAMAQNRSQEAHMDQLDHEFHAATEAMEKARDRAASEHLANPGYAPFRDIWLWCSLLAEYSRWKEGQNALTKNNTQAVTIFTSVIANSKTMVGQIDPSTNAFEWSYAQLILATSAVYLGETSGNQQADQLRAQALAAARAAVQATDKQKNPEFWASLEGFYGLVTAAVAARGITDGHLSLSQAAELLTQSTDALQSALTVYSPQRQPKEWSELQIVLSNMLAMRGLIPGSSHGDELLNQAEAAARAPLAVLNPKDDSADWADTQAALGAVLGMRAQSSSGSQAEAYYTQAAAALRAAIAIRSKGDDPIKLANSEHDLADLLQNQARQSPQPQAIDLLKQSIDALNTEAQLIPKEAFPQRWARTQNDLGESLALLAVRLQGEESNEYLTKAATAYRHVLEVFTRQDYPGRWANTQMLLGGVLGVQGDRATGAQSAELLSQAADAYTGALQLITKEDSPEQWAQAESNLGRLRALQGIHSSGDQAREFFLQSTAAYESVLEAQPQNAEVLAIVSSLYHDNLMDFPKAFDYASRADAAMSNNSSKLNLAEAALTLSRFTACIDLAGAVDMAALESREIPGRLTLLLACQWGAGQHDAAMKTAEALAAAVSGSAQFGWNSTGDRAYLMSAPEFSAQRDTWIKIFQALQEGNGPVIAEAAAALHPKAAN